MLLTIQFPLADFRKFILNSGVLDTPGWPLATPNREFIRYFGNIRLRRLHESIVCVADRAIRFPTNPKMIFPSVNQRKFFGRVYRDFYFDGWVSGRLQVSLTTKSRKSIYLVNEDVHDLISNFLALPVNVPNPFNTSQTFQKSQLGQANTALAQLYLAASTNFNKMPLIEIERWWVQPGTPLIFLEYRGQNKILDSLYEKLQIPYQQIDRISLPEQYKLQLDYCLVPHLGGHLPMWILKTDENFESRTAKSLRLQLMRLHAEHECLRLVLLNVLNNRIQIQSHTTESDDFQYYLNRSLKLDFR